MPPHMIPAPLLAAKLMSDELAKAAQREIKARPALSGDGRAQGIAGADLALALLLANAETRDVESVDWLADYIRAQGRDMLKSIKKHGLRNPPRDQHAP